MSRTSDSLKGIVYLLTSAFLYSIMPVLIRMLGSGGLPPVSQVFLRYIFAFVSAAVYFLIIRKTKIRIERKDVPAMLVATVFGYALTNLFFTYSILYTQVGNALFLFYTYAIITPVFGYLFLKERINRINVIALFVSLIALALLFQPNSLPTWKLGGFFAILSSLGQTAYLILRKKLNRYSAGVMMVANTLVGVAVLSAISLLLETGFYFEGGIARVSLKTWVATVLFGLDNFLAWFAMTKGFEYFKATAGSVILLSELVFGIVFAFLFFREIPSGTALIGGFCILAASVMVIFKGENS